MATAEALAATKWQDRREAWESVTDSTDAETLVTRLSKETNGAVLDAALDAVARVASPDLAPALPFVVQKGLANARGATGRRGLRAIVAFQAVAPDATRASLTLPRWPMSGVSHASGQPEVSELSAKPMVMVERSTAAGSSKGTSRDCGSPSDLPRTVRCGARRCEQNWQ